MGFAFGSLFKPFDGHLQRDTFGYLELSRDDHCDRIAVSERLACDSDFLTDFHTDIFVSVYLLFFIYKSINII